MNKNKSQLKFTTLDRMHNTHYLVYSPPQYRINRNMSRRRRQTVWYIAPEFTVCPFDQWVSEQFLNGTWAQIDYTVRFTSVYAGKYVTEDKSKTDTTKTKHNPEKANNKKYSRTKLAWFSRLIPHSARKRGGLILQSSRAHTGPKITPKMVMFLSS